MDNDVGTDNRDMNTRETYVHHVSKFGLLFVKFHLESNTSYLPSNVVHITGFLDTFQFCNI